MFIPFNVYDINLLLFYLIFPQFLLLFDSVQSFSLLFKLVIDRYWFFITDTDYLYVYVPDNRYSEPIFIYCYKVN